MTRVLLRLLLSVITAQLVSAAPSCPSSCVVCSQDVVICHRLTHIIDVPGTIRALLLTDGTISAIQASSLSDLSNVTLIGLSYNHISVLGEHSFKNLVFLHTLLLDHNLLTNQALQGGALSYLTRLEVLSLGHNLISMIQAGWFKGMTALRHLKLEGNLFTSLDSDSFPQTDLKDLESLDLSDNLISHLDRNGFHGLTGLQTLDLSRNRLCSTSAETFSYLRFLTNLNLDLNSWNCSCQLLGLAGFLSSFIQQPDKILYDGHQMVCVSPDNPAVTTVLELTGANCVPFNQKSSIQTKAVRSVMPQLHARDVAIAAVVSLAGGVGLTLLIVLICCKVSRRKKLKESMRQKQEGDESSTAVNHVNQLDGSNKRRGLFSQANSRPSCDREAALESHSGVVQDRIHFQCRDCSSNGARGAGPNQRRWDNRMNGGMKAKEGMRLRMMMEERRQQPRNTVVPVNKLPSHSSKNSYSHPQRESFSQNGLRHEVLPADAYRGPESLHCETCHRAYRTHMGTRDSAVPVSQHRLQNVWYDPSDPGTNAGMRREPRRVMFDLQSSGMLDRGENRKEMVQGKEEGSRRCNGKIQSGRSLKGKLNLNSLQKNRVHPKRKREHSEKSSSKKAKGSKEKRKDVKEKASKGSCDRKSKKSSEKVKKSSRIKGPNEDEKKKDKDGEGEKKSKMSNGGEQSNQKTSETTPNDITTTTDHSGMTRAEGGGATSVGLGQSLQTAAGHFLGTGLVLGGGLLSSQHPFSLSATSNISLLGAADSQLSVSSRTPQGGNLLSVAPTASTLFSSSSVKAISSNAALSLPGPTLVQSQETLDIASLRTQQNSDPVQGPGPEKAHQLPPDTPVPQNTSLPLQSQAPPGAAVSPAASQASRLNTSDNPVTQAASALGSLTLDPTGEGASPPEGHADGASGSTADVSGTPAALPLVQHEYLSEDGGSSPRRRLRLVLPEKTSNRPPTALERKIR
ncbi:uncharacterized protein lrrc53 isoform X2 [Thalassophryne amazonica]|uniref:uncharacterized protein lrrc53 isoform X2 n=1 Tax=Thalassophryne amazonica TaxID=390379 RepID=UPI001470F30A|nr:uncharacterized protein lrrc53 isoform X2 [Thalassophryne amazonica]